MTPWRAWAHHWGSTSAERAGRYPSQDLLPDANLVVYRAVDVAAAPGAAYRWLCQLKVAPYSYDWIDNRGRRSPRSLTPGADELVVGERFLLVFELVSFEPGRSITLRVRGRGWVTMTYAVVPAPDGHSRLVGVLCARHRSWLVREGLAWGDVVMMRKQLRNLAALASGC